MHKQLLKQIKKQNIDIPDGINEKKLKKLLEQISATYEKNDTLIADLKQKNLSSNQAIHKHFLEEQKVNKRHLKALISAIPDLMFLIDKEGKHLEVYAEGKEHLLVLPKKQLLNTYVTDIFPPELSSKLMNLINLALESEELQTLEFELQTENGLRYLEARAIPSGLKGKNKNTLIVMSRDITNKKRLELDTTLIQTVFEEATEGIIIEDKERNVIHANQAMGRILGISPKELIGMHSDDLSAMIPMHIKESIYEAMTTQGFWHGEVEISPPNAKEIYCWVTLDAILDDKGELSNVVLMITDISEIHTSRNQLKYLASYDTLTDLPNRSLLFKQLKKSINIMEKKKTNGLLLFIDIDHFKEFNDNYGHQVGDKVLLTVAQKITSLCKGKDILGRLSGDEFLLISENINDIEVIKRLINRIQNAFIKPQQIGNLSLYISLSIGVARYPKNGNTPEALINAADQAMYSVKKSGRNNYAFYSQEMSNTANEYYFILTALKDAIHAENFKLYYQPQYSLGENEITTIEVLLRCTHSRIAHIPIQRLISIAEETGIITDITKIVLEIVCKQIHDWTQLHIDIPTIAINLSRKELSDKELLLNIHKSLARYKINPRKIELEITESAILHDNIIVRDNISRLQKLGHRFSIDDYGTGFSSLSNIKTFAFDKLKVDKSFIEDLCSDSNDQVIVSATIEMAKKLGLKVVAEGVETKEQLKILEDFGCDIIQGFYYTKPLNRSDMEKVLIKKFKRG